MARKLIGQVTVEEKNEIQAIFERKNGLNELAQIICKRLRVYTLHNSKKAVTAD